MVAPSNSWRILAATEISVGLLLAFRNRSDARCDCKIICSKLFFFFLSKPMTLRCISACNLSVQHEAVAKIEFQDVRQTDGWFFSVIYLLLLSLFFDSIRLPSASPSVRILHLPGHQTANVNIVKSNLFSLLSSFRSRFFIRRKSAILDSEIRRLL